MRVAASIAHDALLENRAVGLTTSGHRLVSIPADRGPRQRQKIMALLAAVEDDGRTPLAEVLLTGLPKLRRGMTAVIVTPSRDRGWVRTLTSLRSRGVAAAVVVLDGFGFADMHPPRIMNQIDKINLGPRVSVRSLTLS